jgi:hypothetical protein
LHSQLFDKYDGAIGPTNIAHSERHLAQLEPLGDWPRTYELSTSRLTHLIHPYRSHRIHLPLPQRNNSSPVFLFISIHHGPQATEPLLFFTLYKYLRIRACTNLPILFHPQYTPFFTSLKIPSAAEQDHYRSPITPSASCILNNTHTNTHIFFTLRALHPYTIYTIHDYIYRQATIAQLTMGSYAAHHMYMALGSECYKLLH